MPTELVDGFVAIAGASSGAGVLAWMVAYGRREVMGVDDWGQWLFLVVGALCTFAAFVWAVVSFWAVHPLLVALAPGPVIGAVVITSRLTQRSKP